MMLARHAVPGKNETEETSPVGTAEPLVIRPDGTHYYLGMCSRHFVPGYFHRVPDGTQLNRAIRLA